MWKISIVQNNIQSQLDRLMVLHYREYPETVAESRNIAFGWDVCTYRLRGAWGVDMDESPVDPPEGFMLENVWLYWRKYERALAVLWAVFPVRRESDVRGEGTCSTSSPKGMYPGLGKDSFISRSRVSLSERSGGQSESRGLKCCQDQCTPLHDTNGNQKWGGREMRIEIRKVSRHEGAICRHCIAIDFALHSFADIAKVIRSFYKSTIETVPFNVGLPLARQ